MKPKISIFWFRRDLRLYDNAGLFHALSENRNVLPVFIFDHSILSKLENKCDRRIDFIYQALVRIHEQLKVMGSSLLVLHGKPIEVFHNLVQAYSIEKVYCNSDYEPYARSRDQEIKEYLISRSVSFLSFKDQCIFEKTEVLKDNGTPYTVFTPYSKKWKALLRPEDYRPFPVEEFYSNFYTSKPHEFPDLKSIGFVKSDLKFDPEPVLTNSLLVHYQERRDFPALDGTSRLSMAIRFGTISIRALVQKSISQSEAWLNELIWREFYKMILWHFPYVVERSFKPAYNFIPWRNNEVEFERWCSGTTGFPLVDAGMRELNATGFMHNRLRMLVSSFLVKDLLIDYRWGEAYFASKLNDFDLSSNNGGWQWAAGSGCDAAPYFRIFNPDEQRKRFDPDFAFVKHWVPEFQSSSYFRPIVDHALARKRTLAVFAACLRENSRIQG